MNLEEFVPLVIYGRHYLINKLGQIYSLRTQQLLTPSLARDGYLLISLNGTSYRLHRLVITSFIPKPKGKRCYVNHKDGNRANPALDNLEWCTQSENTLHAVKSGRLKTLTKENGGKQPPRAIEVLKEGIVVGEYASSYDAQNKTNGQLLASSIRKFLTDPLWAKTYKGFTFRYKEVSHA